MGDDKLLNETVVPLCSLVFIDNGKQIKGKWDYESGVGNTVLDSTYDTCRRHLFTLLRLMVSFFPH